MVQVGERRFYAVATIVAVPAFVVVCALIARYATPDPRARPIGIGALIFGVLMLLWGLITPYAAIVGPDGSLTFKALTRSVRTNVSRISRITLRTGGRGGSHGSSTSTAPGRSWGT
jgi:hypothetical protein